MTDAELVRRMQDGDREALGVFYARYLSAIWRFAQARLAGDDAAARDVVSETFLAAIGRIGDLDPARGSAGGWLMGIARHKVADWFRHNRPVEKMPEVEATREPDDALAQAELRAVVGRVMTELEDDQRLALEWKYVEGLSVREIAGRLSRTEKGVEALLYRARAEFKKRYQSTQESRRRPKP
jgi:RNA polymerase sigma-70 factor, ECF subfamily